MDRFYTCLPGESQIAADALDFALNNEQWHRYYNFDAAMLPLELAAEEPLILWLAQQGFEFQVGVLRIPANTCYRWHKDTDRLVGINMLLTDNGSKCLFTDDTGSVTFPIVELVYQPNKYYVFNTQANHTVLNFSSDRYVLSVEFLGKDRGMTYADLCKVFKD